MSESDSEDSIATTLLSACECLNFARNYGKLELRHLAHLGVLRKFVSIGTDISELFLGENDVYAQSQEISTEVLRDFTDAGKSLENLRTLRLCFTHPSEFPQVSRVRDAVGTFFAGNVAATLEVLDLQNVFCEKKGAKMISESIPMCTSLTTLRLRGNLLRGEGAEILSAGIAKSGSLTEVAVSHNRIMDPGAASIAKAVGKRRILTTLNLSSNYITAEGAKSIATLLSQCQHLSSLTLNENPLTGAGVTSLFRDETSKKALHHLSIERCNIEDGLNDFAAILADDCCSLTSLNLGYNCGLDLTTLSGALWTNTTLSFLSLEMCSLHNADAVVLARGLKRNCGVRVLSLRNNEFGPEGAEALAQALTKNRWLSSLDLSGNHIGNEGIWYIAYMVRENAVLKKLYLGGNKISEVRTLAENMGREKNGAEGGIEVLDISSNNLGDEGAKALAELLLNKCPTLQNLDIDATNISESGGKMLAHALSKNVSSLHSLSMANNRIGDAGGRAFAEALMSSDKGILRLDFKGNDVGKEVRERLLKLTLAHPGFFIECQ